MEDFIYSLDELKDRHKMKFNGSCEGCVHCVHASEHWTVCMAGGVCRPCYEVWIHV